MTHAALSDLKALASTLTAPLDFVDEIDQLASLAKVRRSGRLCLQNPDSSMTGRSSN